MQFYPIYAQKSSEKVLDLIRSQTSCRLITVSREGKPHVGVFNHFFGGESFYLHLGRSDEQIADIRSESKALLIIEEFFSVIPSYWVDEQYGGAATAYYRYAEFECDVEIIESKEELLSVLQKLMDHYQPEGKYAPLDPDADLYRRSFSAISIVKLTPVASRTKWKLGQNRPIATRRRVVHELRKRGLPGDLRAADEIESWISEEEK